MARTLTRLAGAAAMLGIGVDHIEQYWVDDYRVIPTIGVLFLLLFIGSTGVALVLASSLRRFAPRLGPVLWMLAAVGGIFMAAGALAGLFVSEQVPLFGFMESGYRTAIVLSIVAESAAIVALGAYVWLSVRGEHRQRAARTRALGHGEPQAGRS